MENSYQGEPGRGKNCSHCSFQDFRSLTKRNQVSSVRIRFSHNQNQSPQKGPETAAARKLSKSVENIFDTFWTVFDVFCPAPKIRRKNVENVIDTFRQIFRWPLLRSAQTESDGNRQTLGSQRSNRDPDRALVSAALAHCACMRAPPSPLPHEALL